MNAQVAGKGRVLRRTVLAAWAAPIAAAGFSFALHVPGAAGNSALPSPLLSTVTLPGLTVSVPTLTVPQVLQTTSTATVVTNPAPNSGAIANGKGTASAVTDAAAPTGTTVAGATLLANGTISIPVSSVRAPNRLVVVVSLTPSTLSRAAQTIGAHVEVSDTRGYLVRGARVALRTVPTRKLAATSQQTSDPAGRADFSLRLKDTRMRRGSLLLIVSAADPTAPNLALASRLLHLPIRILSSR